MPDTAKRYVPLFDVIELWVYLAMMSLLLIGTLYFDGGQQFVSSLFQDKLSEALPGSATSFSVLAFLLLVRKGISPSLPGEIMLSCLLLVLFLPVALLFTSFHNASGGWSLLFMLSGTVLMLILARSGGAFLIKQFGES